MYIGTFNEQYVIKTIKSILQMLPLSNIIVHKNQTPQKTKIAIDIN